MAASMSSHGYSMMPSRQNPLKRSEKPPKLPPRDKAYPNEMPKVHSIFFLQHKFNIKCIHLFK